jgi:hypothetical protein
VSRFERIASWLRENRREAGTPFLQLEGSGRSLIVNEEMDGFHAFARLLPARLPGALALTEWLPRVAASAGARCAIFERCAR